jgi:hypothetical protein
MSSFLAMETTRAPSVREEGREGGEAGEGEREGENRLLPIRIPCSASLPIAGYGGESGDEITAPLAVAKAVLCRGVVAS